MGKKYRISLSQRKKKKRKGRQDIKGNKKSEREREGGGREIGRVKRK